jgi:hypothetical protein
MELKEELEIKVTEHALYSISPVSNSASTRFLKLQELLMEPVRDCSKADNHQVESRIRCRFCTKTGRIWVMSSTHANDLLEDAAFERVP